MIIKLPLATDGRGLDVGFERASRAGGLAVAVKADEGYSVYVPDSTMPRTERIAAASTARSDAPEGGRIVLANAIVREIGADWISLDVPDALGRALSIGSPLSMCSDPAITHSFFDWELRHLKKDKNGDWLCDKDGSIVR